MNRLIFSLLFIACIGCGGSDGPTLYPVTGTLTKGGEPIAGVTVTFTPESGISSAGRTSAEGKFVLLSQTGRAGAVPGKHKVVLVDAGVSALSGPIDMSNSATRDAMMNQRSSATQAGERGEIKIEASTAFPEEYGNPQKTPFEYTVEEKSNVFDLVIP